MLLQWLNRISGVGFWLSAAGVCVVTVLITLDVILRLLGYPILGSYEVISVVMTIVVFASFAYGQREKRHIHVTMFIRRLPANGRLLVFGVMSLLSTAIVGYAAYAAFAQAGSTFNSVSSTGVLKIPFYPFYYIEGFALALFTLVLLVDAAKAILAVRDEELAREVMRYWD